MVLSTKTWAMVGWGVEKKMHLNTTESTFLCNFFFSPYIFELSIALSVFGIDENGSIVKRGKPEQ